MSSIHSASSDPSFSKSDRRRKRNKPKKSKATSDSTATEEEAAILQENHPEDEGFPTVAERKQKSINISIRILNKLLFSRVLLYGGFTYYCQCNKRITKEANEGTPPKNPNRSFNLDIFNHRDTKQWSFNNEKDSFASHNNNNNKNKSNYNHNNYHQKMNKADDSPHALDSPENGKISENNNNNIRKQHDNNINNIDNNNKKDKDKDHSIPQQRHNPPHLEYVSSLSIISYLLGGSKSYSSKNSTNHHLFHSEILFFWSSYAGFILSQRLKPVKLLDLFSSHSNLDNSNKDRNNNNKNTLSISNAIDNNCRIKNGP